MADFATLLGKLTAKEIAAAIEDQVNISPAVRRSRPRLVNLVTLAGDALRPQIEAAVVAKEAAQAEAVIARVRARAARDRERRHERNVARRLDHDMPPIDAQRYLELPSPEELRQCHQKFYDATSNDALRLVTCGVCAREELDALAVTKETVLEDLPNLHRLKPSTQHTAHELLSGLLVYRSACWQNAQGLDMIRICKECFLSLQLQDRLERPPKHALVNNLWLGDVPLELSILTLPEQILIAHLYPHVFVFKLWPRDRRRHLPPEMLQNGMKGSVTTFELSQQRIGEMIAGNLMPRKPAILASVLSITYVGSRTLPKSWLKGTFRVRRTLVVRALQWLIANNRHYSDVTLDAEAVECLPEDDIPPEIEAIVRQDKDDDVVERESDTYLPAEVIGETTESKSGHVHDMCVHSQCSS